MIEVVGVEFKENGRIYYFLPNGNDLHKNVNVIVETEKGTQYGKVVTELIQVDEAKINFPLKVVIRPTTKDDYVQNKKNIELAEKAVSKATEMVKKYNLDMKIIDASFTFDRSQLIFNFLADNRVDFRSLAKELGSLYKTRIELRQIGVRDKAKEIGGYGSCGQSLCCSKFMNDFDSISINMAKNQGIALNPNKINGVCGRLLCCLKYEDETYKELRKDMPRVGNFVKTDKGEGKVVSVDVLSGTYKVNVPDAGYIEMSKKK